VLKKNLREEWDRICPEYAKEKKNFYNPFQTVYSKFFSTEDC
jgi:hypothetical protein